MAAGAAADHGFFRGVFEGCISCDSGIERRPYHRNCGCALHSKSKNTARGSNNNNNNSNGNSPNGRLPRCKNLSYPMRRSWSEGSLVLSSSSSSSSLNRCNSSPSSSPLLVEMGRPNNKSSQVLEPWSEEDDNVSIFSIKV